MNNTVSIKQLRQILFIVDDQGMSIRKLRKALFDIGKTQKTKNISTDKPLNYNEWSTLMMEIAV